MRKLLKEPLVHFLLLGGVFFLLFGLVNEPTGRATKNEIVVAAARVEQLAAIFEKTWQRPPTATELEGLVDDFILEEIYYRQAIEMGLDRDDTIIRRRLRQKIEFITEDLAALAPPTEEELQAYLEENAEAFRREPLYTFRQVYIRPDRHADDLASHVAGLQSALMSGAEAAGDASLLPAAFREAPSRAVDNTMGPGFAQQLETLSVGEWQGPLQSSYGLHLVRIDSRLPGRVPPLTEIRADVEREWANEKRIETRRKMNEQLRGRYKVTVEWPAQP